MPVRVKLSLFGQLRTLVDEPQQTLTLADEATVLDLFQVLAARYGPRFEQRVLERRPQRTALQRHVLVYVNDEPVADAAMGTTPLAAPGGEIEVCVYVMEPFSGG